MKGKGDLTRWNRAGLSHFRYVNGNAATHLEELRLALLVRFIRSADRSSLEWWKSLWERHIGKDSDDKKLIDKFKEELKWKSLWVDYPEKPDNPAQYRDRLMENYSGQEHGDWGMEIMRVFARAAHVLTEHIDAYANEGYLETATQWDNLRLLVEMLGYHPAPPSSASTILVLQAKGGKRGVVNKGFRVQHKPRDGGAPVMFETLADIEVDSALNELRCLGWDYDGREFDPYSPGETVEEKLLWSPVEDVELSVGNKVLLVQEGKAVETLAYATLIEDMSSGTGEMHLSQGDIRGWKRGDTSLLVSPKKILKPHLNGSDVIVLDRPHGLAVNDVVVFRDDDGWVADIVRETDGRSIRLMNSTPSINRSIYRLNPSPLTEGEFRVPLDTEFVVYITNGKAKMISDFSPRYAEEGNVQICKVPYKKYDNTASVIHIKQPNGFPVGKVMSLGTSAARYVFDGNPGKLKTGDWMLGERDASDISLHSIYAMRILGVDAWDGGFALELETLSRNLLNRELLFSLAKQLEKIEIALDKAAFEDITLKELASGEASREREAVAIQGVSDIGEDSFYARLKRLLDKEKVSIADLASMDYELNSGDNRIPHDKFRDIRIKAGLIDGFSFDISQLPEYGGISLSSILRLVEAEQRGYLSRMPGSEQRAKTLGRLMEHLEDIELALDKDAFDAITLKELASGDVAQNRKAAVIQGVSSIGGSSYYARLKMMLNKANVSIADLASMKYEQNSGTGRIPYDKFRDIKIKAGLINDFIFDISGISEYAGLTLADMLRQLEDGSLPVISPPVLIPENKDKLLGRLIRKLKNIELALDKGDFEEITLRELADGDAARDCGAAAIQGVNSIGGNSFYARLTRQLDKGNVSIADLASMGFEKNAGADRIPHDKFRDIRRKAELIKDFSFDISPIPEYADMSLADILRLAEEGKISVKFPAIFVSEKRKEILGRLLKKLKDVELALDKTVFEEITLKELTAGDAARDREAVAVQGVSNIGDNPFYERLKDRLGKEKVSIADLAAMGSELNINEQGGYLIAHDKFRDIRIKAGLVSGFEFDISDLADYEDMTLAEITGLAEALSITHEQPAAVWDGPYMELGGLQRLFCNFKNVLRPQGHDRSRELLYDPDKEEPKDEKEKIRLALPDGSLFPDTLKKGNYVVLETEDKKGYTGQKLFTVIQAKPEEQWIKLFPSIEEAGAFVKGRTVIRGNVVPAGHGERKPEKVLGSGNAVLLNQSFVLQVKDISFVADQTQPAGVRADIEVKVDGQIWEQVGTLKDSRPADIHYTVRMTEAGHLSIGFGDGYNGRRLPTGTNNIRASYRLGTGLRGNVPAGSLEKPVKPHYLVAGVRQPLEAAGGGDMEWTESLRETAPKSVLALERAVSLSDFANLAASRSNVWQARAFSLPIGTGFREKTRVVIVPAGGVDLGKDDPGEFLLAPFRTSLEDFLKAHSMPGIHVEVVSYQPVIVDIDIEIYVKYEEYNPEEVVESVYLAVKEAFSLKRRRLGQALYRSEIYKVVESVRGVENSECRIAGVKYIAGAGDVVCGEGEAPRRVMAKDEDVVYVDDSSHPVRRSNINIVAREFVL